jgi:hypothetical protein
VKKANKKVEMKMGKKYEKIEKNDCAQRIDFITCETVAKKIG